MSTIPWAGLYDEANPQTQANVDEFVGHYLRPDGVRFIHLVELRDVLTAAIVGGASLALEQQYGVVDGGEPIGPLVSE